ncbi:hypothetical protein C1646_812448 [Rhizophagus diaphanus]|nr:hypothetical protein C1646_812448 [Rhizophagus diaphanus] [Rhizophagus sp. MUCL 43196]
MLIEEVRMQWQALQQVKDPREKGRIWDKIITNIQKSDMASPALKERTKTSVQQNVKVQKNAEEQVEENDTRQQKKARSEEKKTNIDEIRTLIKEQTDTIAEIMKEQYIHASEV